MSSIMACLLGIFIGIFAGVALTNAVVEKDYDDWEEKEEVRLLRRMADALEKLSDRY